MFKLSIIDSKIEESKSCGCGVNQSLGQTWERYKAYQDSASLFTHIDNDQRNKYTEWATQTRECWEMMLRKFKLQKKGKDKEDLVSDDKVETVTGPSGFVTMPITPEKENNVVSKPMSFKSDNSSPASVTKSDVKTKTKNNRKKSKVRRPRTWRPNDNIWSKIFPFRSC